MPLPAPHRTPLGVAARLASIGVALALAMSATTVPAAAETLGTDGRPITNAKGVRFHIVAHRGGALERPQNSLEAYRYSVEQGFDAIETDLLFTSDGHGVMSHDDTLPARCSHAGRKLHLMTLAQVRQVRCADLTGAKNVPIPTFAELAEVLRPSALRLELDLKAYPGQSAAGERRYARRAIGLLKDHGLFERSSIITFRWAAMLPAIRKLAPDIRVVALDNQAIDLGRVRLAASLGADAYGIKATASPTNLLKYVKAKGMDPTPWSIKGAELQSYSIHFGGPVQGISSDTPARARDQLVSGLIDINPQPVVRVTNLAKAVTVAPKASYPAYRRSYPKVIGTAVPSARLAMLESVKVRIAVTRGPGKGYISLGAAGSPLASSVRVKLPKGTGTIVVDVPVGNRGRLRVYTSKRATVRLSVVGYTNLGFS